MRIDNLGESVVILRELPLPAPQVAAQVGRLPGVVEAWAGFESVGVAFEEGFDPALLRFDPTDVVAVSRTLVVPVLYRGEDLPEVAARCGLSVQQVVHFHAREYECRAVGFCPGFGYLGPLATEIDLPRRATPRPRVAAGSVALAAGMTAVYPLERPGGWWLLGQTPLAMVDEADCYFPLRAGDRVRFVPIDEAEFERRRGERLPAR